MEASLEELDAATERCRLDELAVFPEDVDVPINNVMSLWKESSGMHLDDADDLLDQLAGLSLVRTLDLGTRTVRLHDNTLWYVRARMTQIQLRAAHATMVRVIENACDGDLAALPAGEAYFWHHILRHLHEAGDERRAECLLIEYNWIKARLRATGARGLLGAYSQELTNPAAQLTGRALRLAFAALTLNPHELPNQIFGRLGDINSPDIVALVNRARSTRIFGYTRVGRGLRLLTPSTCESPNIRFL